MNYIMTSIVDVNSIDDYFNGEKDHEDGPTTGLDQDQDQDPDASQDIIVGIDLGTSNSCISVWRNNNLEIIPVNNHGDRTLPSIVSFTNRSRYVGKEAKKQV